MFRSAAALLFAVLLSAPAFAAEPFTAAQKSAIDVAVKEYIMANPQVMISSVEAYYNKQNQNKQAQEGPLKDFPAGLLDYPGVPSVGPKDAKVTVVEFFDYNCGYCKQVVNDVARLIEEDKTVRVVFKDLPILSDTSEVAARYALAANKQGKYLPYHEALLQHQGPITEAMLVDTAKGVGINTDQLKKDANTQEVRDILNKNVSLARDLGVRGTPFFVIGKQKVPGAIGYTRMREIIAEEGGSKAAAAADAPAEVPAAAPASVPAVPEVKTDAIKSDAGAATSSSSTASSTDANSAADPETQAELDKARSDASAMVKEIQEEAAKMQAAAAAAQKQEDAAAAAAKAKK